MCQTTRKLIFDFQPFDRVAYEKRSNGPCFICEMLAGNSDYQHHLMYEDQTAVIFPNKYPTVYGSTLVAPREHREQATGDFTLEDYLTLQRLIYQVAEALRQLLPTERVYILPLGSPMCIGIVFLCLQESPMSSSKPQFWRAPEAFFPFPTRRSCIGNTTPRGPGKRRRLLRDRDHLRNWFDLTVIRWFDFQSLLADAGHGSSCAPKRLMPNGRV